MKTVAVAQMNSTDEIAVNLATLSRQVASAKQQGAQLILLPENCAFMGKHQHQTRDIAEPLGHGRVQIRIADIAAQYGIWILVGGFATMENDKIYQTLLVYDDMGDLVEHYHKRHLFNVTLPNADESYRESDAFDYGDVLKVVKTPVGRVGLAICYDLRFPEHFRALVDFGAEILVLPAAFTYNTGKAHWQPLLQARAIENQCYVLASGQCGRHANGRDTWGHSMILNPWGEIIAQCHDGEDVVTAEVDLVTLYRQRQTFPALTHRR